MSSPWYTPTGAPATGAQGSSSDIRAEFTAIEEAFDLLPTLTANKVVVVNPGGTALIPITGSIPVDQGGTGVSALTDGGILLGSGTGAITAMAVLADGEMIVGDGTTDPAIESGDTLRNSIGLGIGDAVSFDGVTSAGIVSVDDTTNSTSTTTGSIHTDGGLGVVNSVYINGQLLSTASNVTSTRLGLGAGTAFVAGTDNSTAVGRNVLVNNTGDGNTGVGSLALATCTIGVNNTGVGYAALASVTGSHNTAVGVNALGDATSAYNTGIGDGAGSSVTLGAYITCIGYNADVAAGSPIHRIVIGDNIECDTNYRISVGSSGSVVSCDFGTDAVWTRSSDANRKQDIHTSELGLAFINDLRPVTYRWKEAKDFPPEWGIDPDTEMDTETVMTGLIAQEVEVALAKANIGVRFPGWSKAKDGQHISGEAFIFPLINAVNELTAKIDEINLMIGS